MSATVLEHLIQGEEDINSVRAEEEACRQKIVALREGVRNILDSCGIVLSQGTSNEDLISSVAQLCGKSPIIHSDRWDTSWKKEYESLVQAIGPFIEGSHFTADTEPIEVIQTIESRSMSHEKEVVNEKSNTIA